MLCHSCQLPMQSLGQVPIRTGGTSEGWFLFFGPLAEADEDVLPLNVYRCPSCKRVEFFDLHDKLHAAGHSQ
jgi:hypothetical protein